MINLGLYEIRLREEFRNMRRLQQDFAMKPFLTIWYIDRLRGNTISVLEDPSSPLYPEQYKVRYSMPVYTARGIIKRDWKGDFTISVSPEILMQPGSHQNPSCHLDTANGRPFNHHISEGWMCTGGLWHVAKDFGLWYFIIGCGSIINQESAWMDDSGAAHLDAEAYLYWKNDRRKQKISNIEWPFDLRNRIEIGSPVDAPKNKIKIGAPLNIEKPKIKIIRDK